MLLSRRNSQALQFRVQLVVAGALASVTRPRWTGVASVDLRAHEERHAVQGHLQAVSRAVVAIENGSLCLIRLRVEGWSK